MFKKIKKFIVIIFNNSKIFLFLASAFNSLSKALKTITDIKKDKEEKKYNKEKENIIDNISNNGTIEDLLNLKEK